MIEKKQLPHLLEEPPIIVYPTLAKALKNVNKAIILQQVHFLLNAARMSKNKYVEIDGRWWVYNSYKQWKDSHFTWLAEITIKGLFNALEAEGFIISRQGVKDTFDRKKWYTIDYDFYLSYISSIGYNLSDVHEIKSIPSDGQKISDDYRKSETPNSDNESKSANALHPLIQAWADARNIDAVNIGAPIYTAKDLTLAKRMSKWEVPATVDEVKTAVSASKAKEYRFDWLASDIPQLRLKANESKQPTPQPPPSSIPSSPIHKIDKDFNEWLEKQKESA